MVGNRSGAIRRRARCAAAFFLALGCGAGAPDSDASISRDAEVDSNGDAAADVSMDVPPDIQTDTANDVPGTDGGFGDPEWVALSDVPLGCTFERALHPERLFQLEWEECGLGCRYLLPNERWRWGASVDSGGMDDEGGYLVLIAEDLMGVEGRTTVVVDVATDTPIFAMRELEPSSETVCAVNRVGYSNGYFAFPLLMVDSAAGEEASWVFQVSREELNDIEEPTIAFDTEQLPGFANVLQSSSVSPTTAAFQVQPLGEVWIVEGGELHRRAGPRSTVSGSPQRVSLIGNRAIWNEWRTDVRIVHATSENDADVYYSVEGASTVFATDGNDIAWFQGYGWNGTEYAGGRELWVARFTNDPEELEPRRLLETYEYSTQAVVGGGMWVVGAGDSRALIDLRTGEERRLMRHPNAIWLSPPVWVTEDEIGQAGRWRDGDEIFSTFFRLATSAAVPVE